MTKRCVIDKIEIADLRHRARSPGDDGLFVALHGAGHTGWYGPIANEVGSFVQTMIAGAIVGESFTDHWALHDALSQAVGSAASTAASWAVGAVDCAAWDLHGRADGESVARLINPAAAREVPLYASWLSLDITDTTTADTVALVGKEGWQFTKWSLRSRPADATAVAAPLLVDAVERAVTALRRKAAFDAVFTWNPGLLAAFAELIDPDRLLWLEDPLTDFAATYQNAKDVPLAVGERLLLTDDPSAVLGLQPRAFTLDVVGCGGLTRAAELASLARAAGVPVYPHGRSLIPAAHLAAAFPDAVAAVEYQLQWEPIRQRLFDLPWLPVSGQLLLSDAPGLGVRPRSQ